MMFHSDCNCLGVMNDTVVMEDYDRYCDGESNHFGFFYFCFFFFLLPPRFAVNCFPSVEMIDWCFRSFNCLFVITTIYFWPSLTSSLLLVFLFVHFRTKWPAAENWSRKPKNDVLRSPVHEPFYWLLAREQKRKLNEWNQSIWASSLTFRLNTCKACAKRNVRTCLLLKSVVIDQKFPS